MGFMGDTMKKLYCERGRAGEARTFLTAIPNLVWELTPTEFAFALAPWSLLGGPMRVRPAWWPDMEDDQEPPVGSLSSREGKKKPEQSLSITSRGVIRALREDPLSPTAGECQPKINF